MTHKTCTTCWTTCWHNPTKDGFRCTYCGHPISTGPGKRAAQEEIRDRQVNKVRLGSLKHINQPS